MNYKLLDTALSAWAESHNLHIYTIYQDVDVRSIDIVSPQSKRFQLWVDVPDDGGNTVIHIWDYKKRKKEFVANSINLVEMLEEAYQQINRWF